MACAQCHTHKYDPIQHTEYYQFMALMNNADEPKIEIPTPELIEKRKKIETQIAKLEAGLADKFPAPANIEWFTPASAEFSGFEPAEILVDGSFRVKGQNSPPNKDTYTIQFGSSAPRITHLQLEAIPDESVGKGGPGLTDHGNFVVTEIELEVKEGDEATKRKIC